MLSAGEVIGLIVAVCWAVLVGFLALVLVRLARLLTETTKVVSGLGDRLPPLLEDLSLTVGEVNRQLATVEAIAGNVKEASGHVARITGVTSTLLATPVIKLSALRYGVRRALAHRAVGRASRRALERRR